MLLQHLLKWRFQAGRRGRSWRSTIIEQRDQIGAEFEYSPSPGAFQEGLFRRAYATARKKVAVETGLPLETFPVESPFTLEHALDPDWLPGAPEGQSSPTASNGS